MSRSFESLSPGEVLALAVACGAQQCPPVPVLEEMEVADDNSRQGSESYRRTTPIGNQGSSCSGGKHE